MVVAIAFGLVIVASAYASILNIKQIRDWYTPDRTWITVVIGDGLIIAALAVAALAGEMSWRAWGITFGYTVAAGAPIIIWQQIRKYRRRQRAAQALERE